MSGQVADIILDSIKRKITKVCGGSAHLFMLRRREPRLTMATVGAAPGRRGGWAAWGLMCLARRQPANPVHRAFHAAPREVCTVTLRSQGVSLVPVDTF